MTTAHNGHYVPADQKVPTELRMAGELLGGERGSGGAGGGGLEECGRESRAAAAPPLLLLLLILLLLLLLPLLLLLLLLTSLGSSCQPEPSSSDPQHLPTLLLPPISVISRLLTFLSLWTTIDCQLMWSAETLQLGKDSSWLS